MDYTSGEQAITHHAGPVRVRGGVYMYVCINFGRKGLTAITLRWTAGIKREWYVRSTAR
jgi:hypothetical protein